MYLLIAVITNIVFFFFLDFGLIEKFLGLGFCIFSWASNRWGALNIEGAARNPLVIQFMLIGSVGTALGAISIGTDIAKQLWS